MGCFLACFGSSKEEKRRNQRKHKLLLRDQRYGSPNSLQHHTLSPEEVTSAEPLNLNSDISLSDGVEEERRLISRKKVTFDANVKTYEPASVHESVELFSETEKNAEDQRDNSSENSSLLSVSRSENDSLTSSVGSFPPNHRYQNCRDSDDETEEFEYEDRDLDDEIENNDIGEYNDYDDEDEKEISAEKNDANTPIVVAILAEKEGKTMSFNRNSRDRSRYSDYDYDEDENDIFPEKECIASAPTASKETRDEISSGLAAIEEVNSPLIVSMLAEKEGKNTSFCQNVRDRRINIHPVLNPVENIAQWKEAKSKTMPFLKKQKENFATTQEQSRLSFSYMSKLDQNSNQNQEISVDTSLSSWLSSSKSTPVEIETRRSFSLVSNSENCLIEDRPILGALTVEEIKQFSASNSPRKSPSRSPDEMPIIGTVGRYWNISGSTEEYSSSATSSYKGIPNSTSKYREDKKVIWHSTPFETRLERALKGGDYES